MDPLFVLIGAIFGYPLWLYAERAFVRHELAKFRAKNRTE
jgi:hypothetical protein